MGESELNHLAISRLIRGESQVMPRIGFGPLFFHPLRVATETSRIKLLDYPHVDDRHDDLIKSAFEHLREGLSPDRFLSDPILSKALQRECRKLGLVADEPAINLRLLAMRKRGGEFRRTQFPAKVRHLVDYYGPGVEAAMMFTSIRYGASIDDMLAHPAIGRDFVRRARLISPGGTGIEYRQCALQIRKGRNISSDYQGSLTGLSADMLSERWWNLGDLDQAAMKELPKGTGIIELREQEKPLFVMRPDSLEEAVERSFRPKVVRHLFDNDPFFEGRIDHVNLRIIPRKELPAATPKAWEITLIQEWKPRFNWPILVDEAA